METLYGTLFIAIPAILAAFLLFWRNYKPVFWMIAGALVVGLGYLGVTGATNDIGQPIAEFVNELASGSTSHGSPPGRYVTE